jgi:HSP20 family protein
MSGIPWQGRWDSLREFQREVGRIFEPSAAWRLPRPFPSIALADAGEHYLLCVLLPGMSAEEVELSIAGEILNLRGERRRSEGVPDENYRRQERPFGRWARSISLPDRVDADAASAQFVEGVLTVTLPKLHSTKPRRIAVEEMSAPIREIEG